jgi:hypothetical protein
MHEKRTSDDSSLSPPSQQNSFKKTRRNSLCYEAPFSIAIEVWVPYHRSSDAFLSHFYAAKVPPSFTFVTFTTKLFFKKSEEKLALLRSTILHYY